MPSDLVL